MAKEEFIGRAKVNGRVTVDGITTIFLKPEVVTDPPEPNSERAREIARNVFSMMKEESAIRSRKPRAKIDTFYDDHDLTRL